MEGIRCFNWPNCQSSLGCTRSNIRFSESLDVLKQTCYYDANCKAVSCEDSDGDGVCSRSMLSNSCDETTVDEETNWTAYLLKSGF